MMGWGFGWTGDCGCCEDLCDPVGRKQINYTADDGKWYFSPTIYADWSVDTAKPGAKIDVSVPSSIPNSGIAAMYRCINVPANRNHFRFNIKHRFLTDHTIPLSMSFGDQARVRIAMYTAPSFPSLPAGTGFIPIEAFFDSTGRRYVLIGGNTPVSPEPEDDIELIIDFERTSGDSYNVDVDVYVNATSIGSDSFTATIAAADTFVFAHEAGSANPFGTAPSYVAWQQNYDVEVTDLS